MGWTMGATTLNYASPRVRTDHVSVEQLRGGVKLTVEPPNVGTAVVRACGHGVIAVAVIVIGALVAWLGFLVIESFVASIWPATVVAAAIFVGFLCVGEDVNAAAGAVLAIEADAERVTWWTRVPGAYRHKSCPVRA